MKKELEQEIIELANADEVKSTEFSKLAESFQNTKLYKDIFLSIMKTKGAGEAGSVSCKLLNLITILDSNIS